MTTRKPSKLNKLAKIRKTPGLWEHTNFAAVAGWRDRVRRMMQVRGKSARGMGRSGEVGGATVSAALNPEKDGEGTTLRTLRVIADELGVPVSWVVAGSAHVPVDDPDKPTVRVIPVLTSEQTLKDAPPKDCPQTAVYGAHFMTRALLVEDSAMVPEGKNSPTQPSRIILPGDVAIWVAGLDCKIGELCVARTPRGAVVRQLVQNDRGELRLQAQNAAFAPSGVKEVDLLGPVVGIQRRLKQL